MVTPTFEHAHPKIIETTLSFPEFAPTTKNQFIISIHPWDTVNFPVTRLTTPIFDHAYLKIFPNMRFMQENS